MRFKLFFYIVLFAIIAGCGSNYPNDHTLMVSPSSVTLSRGGSQEFEVASTSSPTIAIGPGLKWSSNGGSVLSSGGLSAWFIAGDKPGYYSVSVLYGENSGYASVYIY